MQGRCGDRGRLFIGADALRDFCDFVIHHRHWGYSIYAHNGGRFDATLILEYLIKRGQTPELIMNCTTIMCAYLPQFKIRLRDTFLHLNMSLSAFPATFGLNELSKGLYPYLYNKMENLDYRGPIPDRKYFAPDQMTTAARDRFNVWYDEYAASGAIYDNREQISLYCKTDVIILALGFFRYRSATIEQLKVCPWYVSLTTASFCLKYFRMMFLEEHHDLTLKNGSEVRARYLNGVYTRVEMDKESPEAVIPTEAVLKSKFVKSDLPHLPTTSAGRGNSYSMVSMEWLLWEESRLQVKHPNVTLRHALSPEGEYHLPDDSGYVVDGYCAELSIIYEFYGCYWHFCPSCYKYGRGGLKNPVNGLSMTALYRQTKTKEKHIRQQYPNHTLIYIWECRWSR